MSRKLASEFPQTTPAKPKTLPSRMANEVSKLASLKACNQAQQRSRRSQPLRLIGAPQHPGRLAISAAIRTAGWRKFVRCRDVTRIRRIFGNGRIRGETATERHQTESPGPVFPSRSAPSALFFSRLAPYIGGAGSPAMEINDRRNKPFGPGGSTRRLHPSPPLWCGFRWGRTRIDEGVKGVFFLGMVPPLSGYAIVANDNYAPVAQAA